MTSKQLRIGNNVLYNGIFATVKNINHSTVRLYVANELEEVLANIEDVEPIILTEEILIGSGFKKRKNRHLFHYENKIVISQFVYENNNIFNFKTWFDIRFSPELKYFHQIQNIYYGLTGGELFIVSKKEIDFKCSCPVLENLVRCSNQENCKLK